MVLPSYELCVLREAVYYHLYEDDKLQIYFVIYSHCYDIIQNRVTQKPSKGQ